MTNKTEISFADLGLSTPLLSALTDLGYKQPSPVQQLCIPYLLDGRDVLGMAQTGSGKTAAFSLPMINNIDIALNFPQILVLAPTRELAIQVADAMESFSKYILTIKIVAIYGGQRYDTQLRALRQGPQIIVGTPGRLLDHLKRGTLNLSYLRCLVLDEADEMLRMGFIEDVENILHQIPTEHQTALFSATMPEDIRRITRRFMKLPQEINIQSNLNTRPDITQSYWSVYGIRKNEALVRFLEAEDFDAAIIFVRTKNTTLEIAKILERSGYNSSALNGDMNQAIREQTLERFKDGRIDILIATDIAARGLDVERISLVVNYDIPMDAESYVHRIGRTGRAGRAGRAILFVDNREQRLLRNIERTMKQQITKIELPCSSVLSQRRQAKFSEKIKKQLESDDLDKYRNLLSKLVTDNQLDLGTMASVLLKIAQGNRPLILPPDPVYYHRKRRELNSPPNGHRRRNNNNVHQSNNSRNIFSRNKSGNSKNQNRDRIVGNSRDMELYRIEIGRNDGVEIRHIIAAIANQTDISSRYIGNVKIFANHTTIELPKGIISNKLQLLTSTRIFNKPMQIQLLGVGDTKKIKHGQDNNRKRNTNSNSRY